MGLMVHSLDEIPESVNRDYYIYLLDYGWKEPLSEVITQNYTQIADISSKRNAVFISGTIGSHVNNEILSWHKINGENGELNLPALLITTENPHVFRKAACGNSAVQLDSKIILIPLKKHCKTSTDVITLIEQIFNDIQNGCELQNFKVKKEMQNGIWKRLRDGVILEPNISGIGFNLKNFFRKS